MNINISRFKFIFHGNFNSLSNYLKKKEMMVKVNEFFLINL
jgi:hypothetical protein